LSLHVCLITCCIRVYRSGKFFAYVGMYDLFIINYNFISLRDNNYIIVMLVCKNWELDELETKKKRWFQWNLTCKMYLQYYFHALHCFFSLKMSNSFWLECNVSSVMSSFSRTWFSSVLQSKQLQINVHRRLFSLHRFICSTIFPWISHTIWTCPAQTGSTSVHIYLTQQISSRYKYNCHDPKTIFVTGARTRSF